MFVNDVTSAHEKNNRILQVEIQTKQQKKKKKKKKNLFTSVKLEIR